MVRSKARNVRKRPVLTSPWKIGMLVSLLLIVLSVGAGYYMVRVYDVELRWLSTAGARWSIDSFMFFREMYVLVAAVAGISLFSYFVVASAVRRYKYYLDSGQDYRKMISLADSIDDLTNPAQIARLSDYPELQAVLRNYGDQIREVSEELEHREKDQRSVDLELEIESLLRGDRTEDVVVEGKWWAPLFRKLETYTKDNREIISSIEKRIEQLRGFLGGALLSEGKIMEALGGALDDINEISRAAGELGGPGEERGAGQRDEPGSGRSAEAGDPAAAVHRMENALRRLESEKEVFSELSDENNGLALSIALTAARGGAGDKDLAEFAETARATAERFKKLGRDFTGIASELACCFRALERGDGVACGSTAAAPTEDLSGISRRIERSCASLERRFSGCAHELRSMSDLLHQGLSKLDASTGTERQTEPRPAAGPGVRTNEASIVNFGAGRGSETEDDSFVIDHGKLWEDEAFDKEFVDSTDTQDREPSEADVDARGAAGGAFVDAGTRVDVDAAGAAGGAERTVEQEALPSSGDESDRDSGSGAERAEHPQAAAVRDDDRATGESWMKMPGHRWLKIDVEESAKDEAVDIEVRDGDGAIHDEAAAEHAPAPAQVGRESREAPGRHRGDVRDEADDDPVYDLLELGAVEYVEDAAHR